MIGKKLDSHDKANSEPVFCCWPTWCRHYTRQSCSPCLLTTQGILVSWSNITQLKRFFCLLCIKGHWDKDTVTEINHIGNKSY